MPHTHIMHNFRKAYHLRTSNFTSSIR